MAEFAVRVFGTPITQGTRTQRAQAAAKYENADGKLDQAMQFSLHYQKSVDDSSITSALVYNATGDPITYVTAHDWQGHIAGHFPVIIENGQYVSFYHIGEPHHEDSIGAAVFNIQNYTDSMIAWHNPKKTVRGENNTVYCEMYDPGYFNYCDWNAIFHDLRHSSTKFRTSLEGFTTKVSIDETGNFMAEFHLKAN